MFGIESEVEKTDAVYGFDHSFCRCKTSGERLRGASYITQTATCSWHLSCYIERF